MARELEADLLQIKRLVGRFIAFRREGRETEVLSVKINQVLAMLYMLASFKGATP